MNRMMLALTLLPILIHAFDDMYCSKDCKMCVGSTCTWDCPTCSCGGTSNGASCTADVVPVYHDPSANMMNMQVGIHDDGEDDCGSSASTEHCNCANGADFIGSDGNCYDTPGYWNPTQSSACECKVKAGNSGVGQPASGTQCVPCKFADNSICTTTDETKDWDDEYCFYTAVNYGEDVPYPGEPTVRAAVQCTDSDTYDTEDKCALASGCEWNSAHCICTSEATVSSVPTNQNNCNNAAHCTWHSAACGIDSDSAFPVCHDSMALRTARFGSAGSWSGSGSSTAWTAGTGCVVQIANKDYTNSSIGNNYIRTRNSQNSTQYYVPRI